MRDLSVTVRSGSGGRATCAPARWKGDGQGGRSWGAKPVPRTVQVESNRKHCYDLQHCRSASVVPAHAELVPGRCPSCPGRRCSSPAHAGRVPSRCPGRTRWRRPRTWGWVPGRGSWRSGSRCGHQFRGGCPWTPEDRGRERRSSSRTRNWFDSHSDSSATGWALSLRTRGSSPRVRPPAAPPRGTAERFGIRTSTTRARDIVAPTKLLSECLRGDRGRRIIDWLRVCVVMAVRTCPAIVRRRRPERTTLKPPPREGTRAHDLHDNAFHLVDPSACTSLTRKRSLVQSQYRAPRVFAGLKPCPFSEGQGFSRLSATIRRWLPNRARSPGTPRVVEFDTVPPGRQNRTRKFDRRHGRTHHKRFPMGVHQLLV